jgi:hypothetical protein
MRAAMLVACAPLGPAPSTSDIRASFLAFLNAYPVRALLAATTSTPEDATWTAWGDLPRRTFGAVLNGKDQHAPPVAWARLHLPEAGAPHIGSDPRAAQFVLHAYPRTPEGDPAPAASLAALHSRLALVLDLPGALTEFLSRDLGLATTDCPPAQVGISLDAPQFITQLVDPGDLETLPGSSARTWFMGWALADPHGEPPPKLIHDWLTQLCDIALCVDGYEPTLEAIENLQQPPGRLTPTRPGRKKLDHGQPPAGAVKPVQDPDIGHAQAYEQFTKESLAALETVDTRAAARAFASRIAQQARNIAAEVPEFYTAEFFNIFKDTVVTQTRPDVARCKHMIEDAKAEAEAASTELQARLQDARAAGNGQAEHEVWRERENRQTACQAKIDEATNRANILGLRIDACNDLASALGIRFD